jgi:hypothetical protein
MPSPTDAERIIISRERIMRARHLKLLCRRSARINTYNEELAPLLSVGRLKRCETKSCVMISLFAAA